MIVCSALVVGTEGLEEVDFCTMQRDEIVSIELEGFGCQDVGRD